MAYELETATAEREDWRGTLQPDAGKALLGDFDEE